MSSSQLQHSSISTVKHGAKRASYDLQEVFKLVDDCKLAHLGFVLDGQAVVIPITVWRHEQQLYLHVANKSRIQKLLESGQQVCLSFAESNEWVMSKSAYHHSANYRSAVLYCQGKRIVEPLIFDQVFKSIIEQIEKGRWQHIRPPSVQERKATALLELTIIEGSFKSRSDGPNEEPEDLDLPVWHGTKPVCPYHQS